MIVFFDDYCKICRRTAFIIKKLNWLHLIELKSLRRYLEQENTNGINKKLAVTQIASFTNKWQYGYITIFEICKRLPLFWIFIPLFWVFKISGIGQFLYMYLSVRRSVIPIKCNENCDLNF
jgi:membrane protein / vitamin K-dependent gamma-carboxylase